MEVSKLTLSESTRKQESCAMMILKWMQEHPTLCNHTSAPKMARMMTDIPRTQFTKEQEVNKMIRQGLLHRCGNFKNSSFVINYLHERVPDNIRANASEEDKKRIAHVMELVKDGGKVYPDGSYSTKEQLNHEAEHKKQLGKQKVPVATVEEPAVPVKVHKVSSDASEEKPTITAPVTVKRDKDGLSISITLNININ